MNASQLPQAFLFGGTGHGELILIFVVVLLLFGPRKLPEMARMIGRILSQLRNASNDFRDQVMHIEEDEPAMRPKSESKVHADAVDAVDIVSEEVDVDAVEKEEDPDSDGKPAG
mgnify:CR=1 FL=1